MRRWSFVVVVTVTVCAAFTPLVFAQGGGASTTGSIAGRVTDSSGAVLPGVTVSITSSALIGMQTTVTDDQGLYRFPGVPPGRYTITYELTGFRALKREGIDIALGFTATVNVELGVASLQETVTVTGQSPVIDTSATRVQQNFNLQELNSIPNARDMWALLAITPGVSMGRIDVGGSRAGTQTAYTAYGFGGQDRQVRVLVEGINTTEGTESAGFYFDYGSFEEVFIGTAGQGAEMPTPGVQSQFLGKSGGNRFQGSIYLDFENNSFQTSNIPADLIARGIREHGNEIEKYRDFNINVGGPIKKDKVWWYFSYRNQFNAIARANFKFDKTFDTKLWNPSGKVTYQLSQNNKLIGYYQWGQKTQPNRPRSDTFNYLRPEDTRFQNSGSWVYKGEWNSTLSNNLYLEVRYGDFGYYFPLINSSNEPYLEDNGTRIQQGGDQRQQLDRNRAQATGAVTYFKNHFLGGSHNVRFGGELMYESRWEGFERRRANHVAQIFDNQSRPNEVYLSFPTADGPVGTLSAHDNLLSIAKLDHFNGFFSDQWQRGNVTLNVGVRFDQYRSHIPEQRQIAFTNGSFSIPAQTFQAQTFFTWNSVVPRLGLVYDLTGTGTTVLKANYGYYRHNPGPNVANSANPNQADKYVRLQWIDRNGDRLYQSGEEGNILDDRRAGAVQIDPDISQPYTHEASAFMERQLSNDFGARVGFVYKTSDNLWQTYRPLRSIEAHTVAFDFVDPGVDGLAGTADDRTLTFRGIPNSALPPATNVIMNVPAIGRYKTVEASINKRMSNRWSAGVGFGYSWTKEHNNTYRDTISPSVYPNSPNDTSLNSFTGWGLNAHGTYEGTWGIRVTPVFRNQAGPQYGRTLSVNSTRAVTPCSCTFSGTVLVEPLTARRMETINVLDLRIEKSLRLPSARLNLFLDGFNLMNSHAAETISYATGSSFAVPTNILAPRVARIGFRFEW